jgi:ribosome-binding protein aMBF1 (putative translation factor)
MDFKRNRRKRPRKKLTKHLELRMSILNQKEKKMKTENNNYKEITTFDEHRESRYGPLGTRKRTEFEIKAKAFAIGEIIRDERKQAKMTQEQLAEKTGTRKSFISRIENGHSDIQLSTLYRLIEIGFGKQINLTIS